MAAFTSKADGNWSASGQTTWTQVGVPANGDTVTISHNITVDVSTTIGTSGVTGTAAVTYTGTGTPANRLIIATGATFTLRGDLTTTGSNKIDIQLNAGSTLTLDPASGQTYKLSFAQEARMICNGSVGSRCTVQTSLARGGSAGYMTLGYRGLYIATYTDFVNLGNTGNFGILTDIHGDDGAVGNVDVTITDCTFTATSYSFTSGDSWDKNLTFARNIFSSSPSTDIGFGTTSIKLDADIASSLGTRLISFCGFDQLVMFVHQRSFGMQDNALIGGMFVSASDAWPSNSNMARNFMYIAGETDLYGGLKDWFIYHSSAANPHFLHPRVSSALDGLLFDATSDGVGDCVFPPDGAGSSYTITMTNCIVLPSTAGKSAGNMLSALANTSGTFITIEHCTFCGNSADGGLVGMCETVTNYTGEFPSIRGNLIWTTTSGSGTACTTKGVATNVVNAVTLAGYNGFYGPTSGTVTANSVGFTVPGYSGVKTSTAGDPNSNGNTSIAFHDFTANPGFVDSTRNLLTWDTSQGGPGTAVHAIALLKATPSLVSQASTGLLAWVRAGYVPTSVAYQATSYPGDASTTDAAGTSWPGGSPGVGAMAVYNVPATAGPIFPQRYSSPAKPVASGWV